MKVHTFVTKLSVEAVHQMDEMMNAWLEESKIAPSFIVQTIGSEGERQGHGRDPVLVTSVWYD